MYRRIIDAQVTKPPGAATRIHNGCGDGSTEPPSPRPTALREADLITAAGDIDRSMLIRIAAQRARCEEAAYVATGAPRPWCELLGEELRRTWSIAKVLRECRQGRDALMRISPAEQRIRQLELRLHKLRHGLATPPGAKTRDDIAHCEALLAREKADEHAAMPQASEQAADNRSPPMSHPLNLLIRTLETAASGTTSAHPRRETFDVDSTADAIEELIGTLEQHLPGRAGADQPGATPTHGHFPDPGAVAIDLANAETRLRTLADKIERMRARQR